MTFNNYRVVEDFKLTNKVIIPFTLAGALAAAYLVFNPYNTEQISTSAKTFVAESSGTSVSNSSEASVSNFFKEVMLPGVPEGLFNYLNSPDTTLNQGELEENLKNPLNLTTVSNNYITLDFVSLNTKLINGLPHGISSDVNPENVKLDQRMFGIGSNLTAMELTGGPSLAIDETLKVNSNYSDSATNYNICISKPHKIEDGKIVGPLGKGDLESNLNDIYLEYSRNVPTGDRVCPLTDSWKTEFERLSSNSYNSKIIETVTFNNVNKDIRNLEKYLERF
jgi:hypothetical protein